MKISEQLAESLAEDYTNRDADVDHDWQTIPREKRFDLVLQFLRDEELELDIFSSGNGVIALNEILRCAAVEGDALYAMARVKLLMQDYQPAIDLFERYRQKWLDNPNNSFIGEPDWDKQLDAHF